LDVCADDVTLPTQGKEEKEKYNQKTAVGLSVFDSPRLKEKILWQVYR
jgi:hypothetical protein